MFTRLPQRLVGVLVSTAISLGIAGIYAVDPAHASTDSKASTTVTECRSPEGRSFKEAVALLDPYIEYGADSISLAAPQSVRSQVDPAVLQQLEMGLVELNKQIRDGQLSVQTVQASRFSFRNAGEDSVSIHWWGYKIKLSNDTFNRLSKLGFAGAGAAGIIATIPGATPIAGTIAAVLGGITALLQPCNWNDRGVVIRSPFVGPPYCWPQ